MNIEKSIKVLKEFRNYNKFYKEENKDLTITITLEAKESIDKAIERLLTAYEKETEKNKEYKNLLIDMVNQFAYEENDFKTSGSSEQKIYTAGLSTLEDVFDLLDIDEGIKREDLWKLKEE